MKLLTILGSTGSIGENTLRVVDALPREFGVVGLSAAKNYKRLFEQAVKYGVKHVTITDLSVKDAAERDAPDGLILHFGMKGLDELVSWSGCSLVVCAVVGIAGLNPVLTAIRNGCDVALATKEVLVAAGDLVMKERAVHNVKILPVDSEHSAIFQCLQSMAFEPACVRNSNETENHFAENKIETLILTASGGPFFSKPEKLDWKKISVDEALNHPRWKMGAKVTIDSATMMNKGLELIEACHLYNLPESAIQIWVHPQSIVHSLVHFHDGSYLAQLAPPDMRVPIQFAMTYPQRLKVEMPRLSLTEMKNLTFGEPDVERFPCLKLARAAFKRRGIAPAVMNAANEVAVAAFLERKITANRIFELISESLENFSAGNAGTADEYLAVDLETRNFVLSKI